MRFRELERQVSGLGHKLDRLIKLVSMACGGLILVTLIMMLLFFMR